MNNLPDFSTVFFYGHWTVKSHQGDDLALKKLYKNAQYTSSKQVIPNFSSEVNGYLITCEDQIFNKDFFSLQDILDMINNMSKNLRPAHNLNFQVAELYWNGSDLYVELASKSVYSF